MEPVLELVRGYLATDYDFPSAIEAMRLDIEAASREILEGLTGDALEAMRAANAVNLRMAPLTPDHHFYIDQGANAHLRLVLLAVGQKLVELGRLDQPDDVMFLRYNELRGLIGRRRPIAARELVAARRREREAAERLHPRDWVGTVTPSQLGVPVPRQLGLPGALPPGAVGGRAGHHRHRRRRPASSRASPGSSAPSTSSTRSATATSSSAR